MTTPQTFAKPENQHSVASATRYHLLDLDDFSVDELELVFETTDGMRDVLGREIKKVPTLRGKVIMTLFYEASTRTRISFEEAGKLLSAEVVNVSLSGSSVEKGESLLNTVRTLQAAGADLIVVRHPHSGAPYFMAKHLEHVGVVNAGDGLHAHPTQALIDLYTMRNHFGGSRNLRGAKVVIVGDILHSRVARSNIWGLISVGARVTLCGPPMLLPHHSMCDTDQVEDNPLDLVELDTNLDRAIENADVVMALRLQTERQDAGLISSLREYSSMYQVNEQRLATAKPDVILLHPGPVNEGIEISTQVARGPHSLIEEQVRNGVAVRMSMLYLLMCARQEGRGI
jgi:aspartate carbamoyltransferase catalytic subunit